MLCPYRECVRRARLLRPGALYREGICCWFWALLGIKRSAAAISAAPARSGGLVPSHKASASVLWDNSRSLKYAFVIKCSPPHSHPGQGARENHARVYCGRLAEVP